MKRSTDLIPVYYVNTLSGSRKKNIHLKKRKKKRNIVFHKAKAIEIKCGRKNNIPRQCGMNMMK